MIVGFVYPIAAAWIWGGGWLADKGFRDYEGSGVVFIIGGCAALWGAIFSGPRFGYENYRKHVREKLFVEPKNTVNYGNTL